jgi:hypothetical protein
MRAVARGPVGLPHNDASFGIGTLATGYHLIEIEKAMPLESGQSMYPAELPENFPR